MFYWFLGTVCFFLKSKTTICIYCNFNLCSTKLHALCHLYPELCHKYSFITVVNLNQSSLCLLSLQVCDIKDLFWVFQAVLWNSTLCSWCIQSSPLGHLVYDSRKAGCHLFECFLGLFPRFLILISLCTQSTKTNAGMLCCGQSFAFHVNCVLQLVKQLRGCSAHHIPAIWCMYNVDYFNPLSMSLEPNTPAWISCLLLLIQIVLLHNRYYDFLFIASWFFFIF